jgi:hypothetical protein
MMRDPKVERGRRAQEAWQDHKNAHRIALELLRQSRELADERYVSEAAGFWLSRLAPIEQRAKV